MSEPPSAAVAISPAHDAVDTADLVHELSGGADVRTADLALRGDAGVLLSVGERPFAQIAGGIVAVLLPADRRYALIEARMICLGGDDVPHDWVMVITDAELLRRSLCLEAMNYCRSHPR